MDRAEIGNALAVAGSIATAAGAYLVGLGLVSVLVSVVTGSLLAYGIQSRTQKSAWKREAALRKIDDIYGPLYNELYRITAALTVGQRKFFAAAPFDPQHDPSWATIQPGFRYYLIEPQLRIELEAFFSLYSRFEGERSKEGPIVDAKLLPHLRAAFGSDIQSASCFGEAKMLNGSPVRLMLNYLTDAIIEGKHPLDSIKEEFSGYFDYNFGVDLVRNNVTVNLFSPSHPNDDAGTKFDEVIAIAIKEVNEDPKINWIKKTRKDLIAQSEVLKEKLRKKVEEPWNV